MSSVRPCVSYSNESINEVCSSTASLSFSSNPIREHDSPTVVSYSSSQSMTALSDQFEDAPEDNSLPLALINRPTNASKQSSMKMSMNPLQALAMACAAENSQHEHQKEFQTTEGAQTESFLISQNDVLCGRGGLTNHHPGNVVFRRLVRLKQESYLRASKRQKAGVAKEIVEIIRNLTPSGRFLKKDPHTPGVWMEIGDRKAREKTSQALREGAPELREELHTDKVQGEEDILERQTALIHDGARAMYENSMQHQVQTWSPATMTTLPTEKPHIVSSNRVRVVSSDSDLGGVRSFHHHRKLPSASSPPHVIMDDAPRAPDPQSSYRHPQPTDDNEETDALRYPVLGGKRKSLAYVHDFGGMDTSSHVDGGPRGPRLKLLKTRLGSCGEP